MIEILASILFILSLVALFFMPLTIFLLVDKYKDTKMKRQAFKILEDLEELKETRDD